RAQPPAHLEAVDPRHREVQDHRLVGVAGEQLQSLLAVGCARDVVALERQRAIQRALYGRLVVDDKYACLFSQEPDPRAVAPGARPGPTKEETLLARLAC